MKLSDILYVRHPEPEEIAEKLRQKELEDQEYITSGKKDLNDVQTALADCFLNSWIFAAAGGGLGLAYSIKKKTYLPLAYGVLLGTVTDISSGCYRCQEEWERLREKYKQMES